MMLGLKLYLEDTPSLTKGGSERVAAHFALSYPIAQEIVNPGHDKIVNMYLIHVFC